MTFAAALMILALSQAATAETSVGAAQPASAQATPDSSTVSGVIVPSAKAKESPKVYAPSYRVAPTLGPQAPQISGSANVDQLFLDERFHQATVSAQVVSQLAAQRARAHKAADLINAGHCPEALQSVFNAGDRQLVVRVAEVSGLPSPMERAKGPPF